MHKFRNILLHDNIINVIDYRLICFSDRVITSGDTMVCATVTLSYYYCAFAVVYALY